MEYDGEKVGAMDLDIKECPCKITVEIAAKRAEAEIFNRATNMLYNTSQEHLRELQSLRTAIAEMLQNVNLLNYAADFKIFMQELKRVIDDFKIDVRNVLTGNIPRDKSIDKCGLDTRTIGVLRTNRIYTTSQLMKLMENEGNLFRLRGLGKATFNKLKLFKENYTGCFEHDLP